MFGSKRPGNNSPAAKPRKPKGEAAPTLQELKAFQEESDGFRNKDFEMMWQVSNHPNNYILRICTAPGPVEPTWIMWEDDGTETKIVFQYNTVDTDLINDCIQMQLAALSPSVQTPVPSAAAAPVPPGQGQSASAGQPYPAQVPGQSMPYAPVGQSPQSPFPQQVQQSPFPQQVQQSPFPQQAQQSPFPQQAQQNPFPQQAQQNPFPQQAQQSPFPQQAQQSPFPQQAQQSPFPQQQNPFPQQSQQNPFPQQQNPFPQQAQQNPFPQQSQPAYPTAPGKPAGLFEDDDGFPKAPVKELPPPPPPVYPQFSDSAPARPKSEMEGSLDEIKLPHLIHSIVTKGMTGKLEVLGEESVGSVFFVQGVATHATTPSAYGDAAIRELVTWEKGTYAFIAAATSDMKSVQGRLETTIADGLTMLDQKRHLKRLGLAYESVLLRKHKHLSDTELKLMLMKGAQIDFEFQKKIYDYLKSKRTFTDLLRDYPMDSTTWTGLLFNFISCGLIEIKEADSVRRDVLDFLGADKEHVKTLEATFLRPETGLYSYEAFLFFLEYEFYRFEAYNYPLSLVIFEVLHKRQDGSGGTDLLTGQAANMVSQRINLVKRKLDLLGHFQTLDCALLLPNTKGSSAAWLTNRIYESLTATPIGKDLDRTTLHLAFGVASLPADGDSLGALITAATQAKTEAKTGTFPVVLSRGAKR